MAAGRCIASGPAAQLARQGDALHEAGQRLPLALVLHAHLAAHGVLPAGSAPRSVEAVLDALHALPLAQTARTTT